MDFFKRKKKQEERVHLPPPPPVELEERVQEVTSTAEEQHDRACSREDEINALSARSSKIRRDNALGPRFWQAVGEHRGT